MSIRFSGLLLLVALLGCGSGGGDDDRPPLVEGDLTVTKTELVGLFTNSVVYSGAAAVLSGKAFVPRNASCELRANINDRGAPTGFWCDCSNVGWGRVTWANTTTGASGTGTYSLYVPYGLPGYCAPQESRWSTSAIPLAPGPNNITVTMQDGETIGSASTSVTRY